MNVLLIDNNDSFTYNIVELLRKSKASHTNVVSYENLNSKDLEECDYIIISPGPALPKDYPILKTVLDTYAGIKPILGICLGHQAICEYFGAKLFNLSKVCHGQAHEITTMPNSLLYNGLDKKFKVGLYHSWAVEKESIPDCLEITATSEKGLVMSIQHKKLNIQSVQYHPESYISTNGLEILNNFLDRHHG